MRFIRDLNYDSEKMLERIYKDSKNFQVRERAQCILLSFHGTTIDELVQIFKVTRKTIYNWLTAWEDRKLIGFYNRAGRGRKKKLPEEREREVIQWIKEEPKNLKKIQAKIQSEWQINLSKDTLKRIAKKYQMRWKRMRRGIAKDPDESEIEVKLPHLQSLKERETKGEIDLRYFDETGWDMNSCIPYAWQEKESTLTLKSIEGKRINILGIMNRNNELFYELQEGIVTSEIVISFFDRFVQSIKMETVIVLDQASIHTSDLFLGKLEEWEKKKLKIFWLPTYSPHLNLIEILWRFLKYEWIKVSAYQSRDSLVAYTKNVLDNFGKEYVINFA
jgi:transposase